ncbi:MAG: ArnT family glycosyltransferase, partial [Planctomycetia bacterium]
MTISDAVAPDAAPWSRRGWWAAVAALLAALAIQTILRLHAQTTPLDCDEAAYLYIGHRLLQGDRLYVDVFENKPPGCYAVHALAAAVFGYGEAGLRWTSLPFALGTIAALWAAGLRWFGPTAAGAGALALGVAAADPFVYGYSANLEVFVNFFTTVALAVLAFDAPDGGRKAWLPALTAGLALGLAVLVKHVAAPHVVLAALLVFWNRPTRVAGFRAVAWLTAGVALPWLVAVAWIVQQQVLFAFLDALLVYGPELTSAATKTTGLQRLREFALGTEGGVWWGTGIWPVFAVAGVGAGLSAVLGRERGAVVVAAWTAVGFAEAYLPGMNWQHYYMLPLPAACLLAAAWWSATAREIGVSLRGRQYVGAFMAALFALAGPAALGKLVELQVKHFVKLTPAELRSKLKGGRQWVALRGLGMRLSKTPSLAFAPHPSLFVWGWQSPLHVYSGLDSPTPYFFTDPLMQRYIDLPHPMVDPRKTRIMQDLTARPPALI